tara:strand:- start:560 stop:841 length:282 start_codon:yes stop_codon:yes gene_type:complete
MAEQQSKVQSISRQTLARGLIKYDTLSRGEALDVLRWKCTGDALDAINAAPDPFADEIQGLPMLQSDSPFLKAITTHFGLKLAVIKMIFRKGA